MNTYNVTVQCRHDGAIGIFGETFHTRVDANCEADARVEARIEARAHGYEPFVCTHVEQEG